MLLQIGPLLRLGSKCYYGWDFYYAWVQMLLQMGPLLHLGPVITLVPSTHVRLVFSISVRAHGRPKMISFQICMRSSRYAPQSLQRAVNVKEVRVL